MTGKAYIVGTCDTKEADLRYVKDLVVKARPGATAVLVDISTRPVDCAADVSAHDVAMHHPAGPSAVFVSDRAVAVRNMGEALRRFLSTRSDIDGIIGLGGSGGTSMIGPAMQALPIGIPKVLVSTLASGDVAAYVGPSDVNMFHSVTDIAGLNRVSAKVLANAAHALVGMMTWRPPYRASDKKAVGLSMFGVTTPCVLSLTEKLHKHWDCLVFHATGTGGRSMEKLIDQGDISAVLDMTTTEICDLIVGGVLSAGEERLDSIARTGVPYVGSCGALDMVNFWARETVPRRFEGRLFHVHNAQVTLMRTTADESAKVGQWIGDKLNRCQGPVRFLLPEKGVSALDIEGGPFYDPDADAALFGAIEKTVLATEKRHVIRIDHHINAEDFVAVALDHFNEITDRP